MAASSNVARDSLSQSTARVGTQRGIARRVDWEFSYRNRIAATDALVLISTFVFAHLARFGTGVAWANLGVMMVQYVYFAAILAAIWYFALAGFRSRDPRVFGSGADEYATVARASLAVFGALAICTLLFQWQLSRVHLAIVFSLGPIALVVSRKLWRNWLHRQRAKGDYNAHVLVVGGVRSGRTMAMEFEDQPSSGYRVEGVWIPDRVSEPDDVIALETHDIPVFGIERTLAEVIDETDADTVAVTDSEHLGPDGMRELAWELGGQGIHLLVAPNIVNFAGPRIHMRSVANRPIIKLEEPQYEGASRIAKTVFDRSFALMALIALSPFLLAAALAVKFTSPGPVLYRSDRVGVGGESFRMLKFRSMKTDADHEVQSLLDQNDGAGPLFKMRDDPRVTGVGRFLRRYSIDELPQLVNVLKGEMSMVGPRPPLRHEVELYGEYAHRRLLVRQGLTGLWQVSGRSDLSWEDSIRLDLDYVENWSLIRDIQIIWRTIRAVVKSEGAY